MYTARKTATKKKTGSRAPKRFRRPVYRGDSIRDISKVYIKRLAHKAGVEQVSGLVYEETRGYIQKFLHNFLKRAVLIMENDRKKTLNEAHTLAALESMGEKLYIDPKQAATLKTCVAHKLTKRMKKDPTLKVAARVEYYGGKACLMIPKAPFLRLLREVIYDYKTDVKITSNAAAIIQYVTEEYTLKLLEAAHIFTKEKKVKTLYPKHIQYLKDIPREIHVFK